MGNRGPKPKGGYTEKTRVLSTRITAPTREALEQASAKSGLSISSEVESRLRRSFIEDDKITDALGGRQMYAVLRLISSSMSAVGQHSYFFEHRKLAEEADWLGDPYAFDQAIKATTTILESLRPEGDVEPKRQVDMDQVEVVGDGPQADINEMFRNLGTLFAHGALKDVADAEPTEPEPNNKATKKQKLSRRIATDLGPMAKNIKKGSDQ